LSNLNSVIKEIKGDTDLENYSEAEIKHRVILKILNSLGWDIFSPKEVKPEYSVESYKVDLVLLPYNKDKVFIEIKRASEDLEKHQEQLLNYAFREGVNFAILTNGIDWWFYLPLKEGDWKKRKFLIINIKIDDIDKITDNFKEFLSKDSILSGRAIKKAEEIYRNKEIEKILPEIFQKILKKPDELLVDIIIDYLNDIYNYDEKEIDKSLIRKFLKNLEISINPIKQLINEDSLKNNYNANRNNKININNIDTNIYSLNYNFANHKIKAFYFENEKYNVSSWKDMLLKILELLLKKHPEKINLLLNLKGRKRPYFSKNKLELREPLKLFNTDIYVETNLSANQIAKISRDILKVFGYLENIVKVEATK